MLLKLAVRLARPPLTPLVAGHDALGSKPEPLLLSRHRLGLGPLLLTVGRPGRAPLPCSTKELRATLPGAQLLRQLILSQAGFHGDFESRTICPRDRRLSRNAQAEEYPQKLVDRGVRLAIESGRPVAHVAAELGLPAETLRKKVRQAGADEGCARICPAPRSARDPGAEARGR